MNTEEKKADNKYKLGLLIYIVTGILLLTSIIVAYNPPETQQNTSSLVVLLTFVAGVFGITGTIVLFNKDD